jgi:Rieske Fe-S protein
MVRRTFLALGLLLAGIGRRAWAQVVDAGTRYFPLARPVRIPLAELSEPWRPVAFVAEAAVPLPAGGSRRVLISGVVFRKSEGLSALCLTCPHEQCRVDLVTDQTQLVKMTGRTDSHPLFECGCHSSVFDAQNDGARVAGETPRGLFRFRFAQTGGDSVEISEIEEDALTVV